MWNPGASNRLAAAALLGWLLAACSIASPPRLGRPGTLEQEMRYMRWEGIPMAPAGMDTPRVPPEENAAPLYQAISRELDDQRLTAEETDLLSGRLLVAGPSAADIEAGRRALARRGALMALVHKAAASPGCRFQRDWSLGPSILLPEYAVMRRVAQLLKAEAAIQSAEGRTSEAAATLALLFNVADHASSDPILLGLLTDHAVRMVGLEGLEDLLRSHPDAATARFVRAALANGPRPNAIARAMQGEVVCGVVSANILRKGTMRTLRELAGEADAAQSPDKPLPPGFVDENLAYVLWFQRGAINASKLPYSVARDRLDAFQADIESRGRRGDMSVMLGTIVLPALTQLRTREATVEAYRRILAAATQAVLYHSGRGKWPEALYGIPLDPFTGDPLVYRQEADGFAVFSRGETGRYDGEPGQVGRRGNLFRI